MNPRPASLIQALYEVYLTAEALDGAERVAFLERQELSADDLALIEHFIHSPHSLSLEADELPAMTRSEELPPLPSGTPIGIYRIDALLGKGGQGTVYLASHAREAVDRQVAIKLPRRLAGSSLSAIRREAQTLAKLDHPAIARFLSVDRSGDDPVFGGDQVFLVTEYVKGLPLDAGLRDAPAERVLAVFESLCAALNHAHQQGIAHLDLKPSNILIDAAGQPKILDFGLGLLYSKDEPTGQTLGFTQLYAAPEQLAGDASAACDTFALGALLLQVLARVPPGSLRGHIAQLQSTDWRRHPDRKAIGHDLHAILRRACAPHPGERYASIAQFGADLRAVLDAEPVSARPWTWRYALLCLARRRPAATAAAIAAVLLLSVAFAALAVQHASLLRAEAQAQREAERARMGLDLVVSAMESGDPENTPEVTDAERALVERLRRAVDKAPDPELRANTDLVVARIAHSTGDTPAALELLDRVIPWAESRNDTELLADALTTQADMQLELAHFDQADAALARLRALPGDYGQRSAALHAEGRSLIRAGKLDEGEATLRAALAASDDDRLRVRLTNALGTILTDRGSNAEAAALFDEQRPVVETLYGSQSVSLGVNAHNRALAYFGLTRTDDALRAVHEAEQIYTLRLGADSLRNADSLMLEAMILQSDDSTRAAACLEQAIAVYRKSYGEDHPKVAHVLYTLGELHRADGDAATALREFETAHAIAAARLPAGHPLVVTLVYARGAAQLELDHADTALPLLTDALASYRQINAEPDITKAIVQNDLSRAYRLLGRVTDSEASSRYAYDLAAATLPTGSLERAEFEMERAASLAASDRIDEAGVLYAAAQTTFDAQADRPAARKARPKLERIGTYIRERSAARKPSAGSDRANPAAARAAGIY